MLQNAFVLLATWYNMLAIFGGMLIGVIVGCIPGMTGAMAVALILPFSFHLSPLIAILLLVSVYKGAIYGGSISAIL
ncbi:MAG: tripartite tricarboxylate transporter permease, partial [Desulfovibrionaceae bacterium]|nr:tripartite tricarboxylate transporter permease [Desulfovibrionaceae bacterium]